MAEHSTTSLWYSDDDDIDDGIVELIDTLSISGNDEDDVNLATS